MAGLYSADAAIQCSDCPEGTYSAAEATTCTDCSVGYYVSETGASACVACAAGTYAGSEGGTICTDCPAGYFASSTGASSCAACDSGYYSGTGEASCTKCSAGKFQNATGATSCRECPRGRAQADTGEDSCDPCDPGTYMADTGETTCLRCSSEKGKGYWSSEGATECDQAAEGYFFNTEQGEPEVCQEGVDCSEAGTTTESMELAGGLYKFAATSADVYTCPSPLNCKGGRSNATVRVGQELCIEGAYGPLCALWCVNSAER